MALAPQIRNYSRSGGVVFFKTRDEFGELSNMSSRFPLRIAGVQIPSSEALYQCCRFPHLPDVQQKIIDQRSPMTAKMVTKPYRDQTRSDWDYVRVPIMKWCLKVKLIQNWDEFRKVLIRTGDAPIIEQSMKDPFWGAIPDAKSGNLKGANVLGRLLMELRAILREDPSALYVVDPVPIQDFHFLGLPMPQIARPHLVYDAEVTVGPDIKEKLAYEKFARDDASKFDRTPCKAKRVKNKKSGQQIDMFPATEVTDLPPNKAYHVVQSKRGGWDVLRMGPRGLAIILRLRMRP